MILIGSVLLCISYQQVPPSFTLSSSDERIMSVLAEVVCISALENTERQFLEDFMGKTKSNLVRWFRKPKRTVSKDSSVVIYKLFEDEIVENAKSLLKNFNLTKGSFKPVKTKSKYYRWTATALSKLEKIGGPEFSSWTSEHVPAYRLQIDANQHKDVKFEGWRKSAENWCEVFLTHSQMVLFSFLVFSLLAFSVSCHGLCNLDTEDMLNMLSVHVMRFLVQIYMK